MSRLTSERKKTCSSDKFNRCDLAGPFQCLKEGRLSGLVSAYRYLEGEIYIDNLIITRSKTNNGLKSL